MTGNDKISRRSGSGLRRICWLTATAVAALVFSSGSLFAQTATGGTDKSSSVIVNEEVLESLGNGTPYVPPRAVLQRSAMAPDEDAQPTVSTQAVRVMQPSVIVNESALPEPAIGRPYRSSPAPARATMPGVALPDGVQPDGRAGGDELRVAGPAVLAPPPVALRRNRLSVPAPASGAAALPPAEAIVPPTAAANTADAARAASPVSPEPVAPEPVAPEPVAPAPASAKPAVAKPAPNFAVKAKPAPGPEVAAEPAPEPESTAAAESGTEPLAPVPMAKPAAPVQDLPDQPMTAALATPELVVVPVQDTPDKPETTALAAPEPVVAPVQDTPDEPETTALAAPEPVVAPVQVTPDQPSTAALAAPAPAERLSQSAALRPDTSLVPSDGARVIFDAGSAELSDAGKRALAALADHVAADGALGIQLLAYADGPREGDSRARRLSLSRALVVRAFLIERGIRATRMDVRALGNKTDQGPSDRVDVLPEG